MRTLIVLAALMASCLANAEETPTQFMQRYVGYFNTEDSERYQTAFKFPVVRFTGGAFELLSDPSTPMANFENIKAALKLFLSLAGAYPCPEAPER